MSTYDGVNQKHLEVLLDEIDNETSGLPDFQRDYVWDPGATIKLIASIARSYPAGSILTVGNSGNHFVTRKFEDAPDGGSMPKYLVLDGQQRLTSLYQAFFGKGEYRYFLDIDRFLAGEDLMEGEVIQFEKAKKKISGKTFHELMDSDFAYHAEKRILPLSHIFGQKKSFHKWSNKVAKEVAVENRDEFIAQMEVIEENFADKIEKYNFPVVSLSSDTSIGSLCTIFETLNRSGVRLTIFELLTARFWKDNINLRTLWDKALEDFPTLSDYEVEPYQIIQAISLITYPSASCKRDDILKLKADDINSNWNLVVKSMVLGLEILHQDCKILNAKWLPTSGMLGPLAAILAIGDSLPKSTKGVRRSQIVRWLWCAIFSQRYEAAANTRGEKDVNELRTWFGDSEKVPEAIKYFTIEKEILRQVASKNAGIYKGVICLTMKTNGGSLDFVTGAQIQHQMVTSGLVDDHHIFPKKYLEDLGYEKNQINCVLNRTLIDRETNMSIAAKAPSDYVTSLKAKNIDEVLASHLIPIGRNSPIYSDDYEKFLELRLDLIKKKIDDVTGIA
jgi:hypothetical protein